MFRLGCRGGGLKNDSSHFLFGRYLYARRRGADRSEQEPRRRRRSETKWKRISTAGKHDKRGKWGEKEGEMTPTKRRRWREAKLKAKEMIRVGEEAIRLISSHRVVTESSLSYCWVTVESSWGRRGVIIESPWGCSGVVMGSSSSHHGVLLGSSWGRRAVIMGSFGGWPIRRLIINSLWGGRKPQLYAFVNLCCITLSLYLSAPTTNTSLSFSIHYMP